MKRAVVVLLLIGCVATARSEVKDYMDQMLEQIFVLKPFIASDAGFTDPENAEQIAGALEQMALLSRKINHEDMISKTGFQVSGTVLNQQLEEVVNVFSNGNKEYALWNLRSTLGVCMSCHTQLPAVSTRFSALNRDQVLTNPFEEAEFLFVIRNFDDAMPLYSQVISEYPGNKADSGDVETAVYRQLYYYLRVARDTKGLSDALQRDAANALLPTWLREQIVGLQAAVATVHGRAYPRFTADQEADLQAYVEAMLQDELVGELSLDSPDAAIAALQLSGVLYEYLKAYPDTPLKPNILYWLSFCERRYLYQSTHALPDLYLKQCVLDYPTSPVASQCLAEYVNFITVAFTGSSGTHIPDNVAEELARMEALVKNHQ